MIPNLRAQPELKIDSTGVANMLCNQNLITFIDPCSFVCSEVVKPGTMEMEMEMEIETEMETEMETKMETEMEMEWNGNANSLAVP